jgi:hypothetical protein
VREDRKHGDGGDGKVANNPNGLLHDGLPLNRLLQRNDAMEFQRRAVATGLRDASRIYSYLDA